MKRYLSKNFSNKEDALDFWSKISHKTKLSPALSFGKYIRKSGFMEFKLVFYTENSSEVAEIRDELELQESTFLTYN